MNLPELRQRVEQEGYARQISESGPRVLTIHDLRLEQVDGLWRVCDTERGETLKIHVESADESAACAFWYERISGTMTFLSGFADRAPAERLQQALAAAGLQVWRNDIPQLGSSDPVYRIFVAGRDLVAAKRVAQDL